MERTVRIFLDNVVLEKTMETRGNLEYVRERLVLLLAKSELELDGEALEISDNWERGFIKVIAGGEINLARLKPPDGVITLSIRHDYQPGPVQHLPKDEAEPVAPSAKRIQAASKAPSSKTGIRPKTNVPKKARAAKPNN